MEVEILLSTNFLKCRFCRFSEDDPERFTTVAQGNIKDPHHDFIYYEETDTLEEATIYTSYAFIECPTLKCSQLLIPNENNVEERQKKIFEEFQKILNEPETKKMNILRWKLQSLLGKRVKVILRNEDDNYK
ncbi:MAG: hypothetical protein NZ845_02260 [Thermodesulfovibrio sp.]|nr:hypothetical protein [Thermodesulfovibrio sp.]MDW7973048.1 hypothetical protein [Thermodesulfovibrio sp.]